jgi:hypothetical protein
MRRIRRWWCAFGRQAGKLDDLFRNHADWDLPGWMDEYLHAIDPRLCWEFGPGAPKGHRLVITPENDKHLRPLVDLILGEAPRIPGWQFFGYRLAESIEAAAASVEGRTRGRIDDLSVQVWEGPLNTVALRFVSPRYLMENESEAWQEAFVAVESLLGEEALDKWVGPISTGPARPDRRALPLDRLRPTVNCLIDRIREQMPQEPCWQRLEGTYTLRPADQVKTARDFPGRKDLLAGVTMYWDMVQAASNGGAFFSDRFSCCGETFCHIKIDGADGLQKSAWTDRGQIEESLNRLLLDKELGACIGGGTGVRYSYIDLALTDLRAGCEAVRSLLREGQIPRRSWIMFFDATLQAEWIGIHEDTPEPLLQVE